MEEKTARLQVSDTGRELLKSSLVARTWGNFSARIDDTHFVITPSGLGYEHMTPDDIVIYDLTDKSYTGTRKPSSEKGIHAAAYQLFPEVNFIIHTHQIYATALGLTGSENLKLTDDEKKALGGIAFAKYGLPGTKKLKKNVSAALESGAHTVLMTNHGALICGADKEEAMKRAALLEEICKRNYRGTLTLAGNPAAAQKFLSEINKVYPDAVMLDTPEVLAFAATGRDLRAQLDDMAQMIGSKIPCVDSADKALKLLGKHNVVLVKGSGAVMRGTEDDVSALKILTHKSCLAALHTSAVHKDSYISLVDALLMRFIYLKKYSRKKEA